MENCIICGSANIVVDSLSARYLGLPDGFGVVKCRNCSVRWLSPASSRENYQSIYEMHYFENLPESYDELATKRIPYFRRRIQEISEMVQSTRISILDIGAGTGEFLNEAIKAGMRAEGIEPSEFACRRAREKFGIALRRGDVLEMDLGIERYDVVYMNHVLEHIVDPHNLLKKVYLSLKKGGYLIVEIPYQFGAIYERLNEWCGMVKPIEFSLYSIHHPFFYTPKALKFLLSLHSYSNIKVSTWKDFFYLKKIDAYNYCKSSRFSSLEVWLRVFHILFKEKGKNFFVVSYARK